MGASANVRDKFERWYKKRVEGAPWLPSWQRQLDVKELLWDAFYAGVMDEFKHQTGAKKRATKKFLKAGPRRRHA